MFKLDSVFLFALDVVKGPYVHCSAPIGNGVADGVLAVATPLHPASPAVWGASVDTPSKASAATTTTGPDTTCVSPNTPSGHTEGKKPPRPHLSSPTTSTGFSTSATVADMLASHVQARHDEQGKANASSADTRFAGLSDVFIPRSEFSRRVLWLYPAETRLLYLYYPEEIPGDHYPRKTLRYSLCMAFRVDPRMVTVGKQLLNQLVQPYSMVLMTVAEELRNAEMRYGYVSRGLESSTSAMPSGASHDFVASSSSTPRDARTPQHHPEAPPMRPASADTIPPREAGPTARDAVSSSLEHLQVPRQGTFPAVLPSELGTPSLRVATTPMSGPSPLSNATFTSAMRGSGSVKLSAATGLAHANSSALGANTNLLNASSQASSLKQSIDSLSGVITTPWTASVSVPSSSFTPSSAGSSNEGRCLNCLNCFVTPNLEQRWVSLQAFFSDWFTSMTHGADSDPRRPPTQQQLQQQLRFGGASEDAPHVFPSTHATLYRRSSSASGLSPTSHAATGVRQPLRIHSPVSQRGRGMGSSTKSIASPNAANGYTSGFPRHASSASGVAFGSALAGGYMGSVDTMASAGAEMESTVFSPLVAYPKDKNGRSCDYLARITAAAAASASGATAGPSEAMPFWSQTRLAPDGGSVTTRHIIEALPALQARWKLVQQLAAASAAGGETASRGSLPDAAQPASTTSASAQTSAFQSSAAAVSPEAATAQLRSAPSHTNMLHLSDTIRFHVRRMAPLTCVKAVSLGFIPVLISTPSARQLDKMDMAVQRVLQLINGENSVADVLFQLTLNTASTLYEVCHAVATQSPQLFNLAAEPAGSHTTSTGGSAPTLTPHWHAAQAAAATSAAGIENPRTAMVIPGSEYPLWTRQNSPGGNATTAAAHTDSPSLRGRQAATGAGQACSPSSLPSTHTGGGMPAASAGGSSGASLDTNHTAHTMHDATMTNGESEFADTTNTPLCVSRMQVQLRKMPQASPLFTRWAPTPVVRVTVWHTAPRSLLETRRQEGTVAATGTSAAHEAATLPPARAAHRGPTGEHPALFRSVLPLSSPSLLPSVWANSAALHGTVSTSPSLGNASAAAALTHGNTSTRRTNMSPLHLASSTNPHLPLTAAASGMPSSTTPPSAPRQPANSSHNSHSLHAGQTTPSSKSTPGSGNFAALPRAATTTSATSSPGCHNGGEGERRGAEPAAAVVTSPLVLPTVDVVRVSVDLPPIWHTHVAVVTEALLQLERCGMVRLLEPWAPHTTYRVSPRLQTILADRHHPARQTIGRFLLTCAVQSHAARTARRGASRRTTPAAAPRQTASAKDELCTATTTAGTERAGSTMTGGDVASPVDPPSPRHKTFSPLSATPASTATKTIAVGSLCRTMGVRVGADAEFDESIRSGRSSTASLLSHALSYDAAGGTLRLNLGCSATASSVSRHNSPTMVVSSSLGTHVTHFTDADDGDDDGDDEGSASCHLGPLAHTLLPHTEPAFLSHSMASRHTDFGESHGRANTQQPFNGGFSFVDRRQEEGRVEQIFNGSSGFSLSPTESSLESSCSASYASSLEDAEDEDGDGGEDMGRTVACASERAGRDEENHQEVTTTDASRIEASGSADTHPDAVCLPQRRAKRKSSQPSFTEADISATASAALCALGKFTNTTIRTVQQTMRWTPAWSSLLDGWSPQCCRDLVELALLNDWLEVVY